LEVSQASNHDLDLLGLDRQRHPKFRPDFETTFDGVFDIFEGFLPRFTLAETTGNRRTFDDPNTILVAVESHVEKHGCHLEMRVSI